MAEKVNIIIPAIKLDDETISTVPLVALEDNPSGGILKQIQDTIQLWFE